MSLVLVPLTRLFAQLRFVHDHVTLGFMYIYYVRSKLRNKFWISKDTHSMNSDRNICQVCLVQKGHIYYVQDIIDLPNRCNIGIPWEICSHYFF